MNKPVSAEVDIELLAQKRAKSKLRWYAHAAIFITVNLALFLMSEYAFGHRRWSIQPVLGWAVGLVFHGISVFLLGSGTDLRERLVQKERDKLLRQRDERRDDATR